MEKMRRREEQKNNKKKKKVKHIMKGQNKQMPIQRNERVCVFFL